MTATKRRPKPFPRHTGALLPPEVEAAHRERRRLAAAGVTDLEERRRFSTVASDGKRCMIYGRAS